MLEHGKVALSKFQVLRWSWRSHWGKDSQALQPILKLWPQWTVRTENFHRRSISSSCPLFLWQYASWTVDRWKMDTHSWLCISSWSCLPALRLYWLLFVYLTNTSVSFRVNPGKGKSYMLPFHALSWSAFRGSWYLSGRIPADHLYIARTKPVVRNVARKHIKYYILQIVILFFEKQSAEVAELPKR